MNARLIPDWHAARVTDPRSKEDVGIVRLKIIAIEVANPAATKSTKPPTTEKPAKPPTTKKPSTSSGDKTKRVFANSISLAR